MFKIIKTQRSKTDHVTKYILSDEVYGLNEVSVINKMTKDIIVLPSQTNCNMGCTFCHLTGTTRPVKNFSSEWFLEVVKFIVFREELNRHILISFMGAGEPLLNVYSIINGIDFIHSEFKNVRFAISTMMPSLSLLDNVEQYLSTHPKVSIKLHLSVHGIGNRNKIVKSSVTAENAIKRLQEYNSRTNQPIEYHYTLVNDVNDSMNELIDFSWLVKSEVGKDVTVKFLSLSENGNCEVSKVSNEYIQSLFKDKNVSVEFYDPPGRDVGSSCGMFDRSIYM
jgi:adenine C2-methylase RlmN of 23S rRNA A2503 and tRNA A37